MYMKIIFTIVFKEYCYKCNTLMVFHASYYVNYKSNALIMKIIIIRLKCEKCNETHAMKPHFLASRHQYDTFERQNYVLAYNNILPQKNSLRSLQIKMFLEIQTSHTTMYYWVIIAGLKAEKLLPEIVAGIQQLQPSIDITDQYLDETSRIKKGTRDKKYVHILMQLINWVRIYLLQIEKIKQDAIVLLAKNPYIYINQIFSMLMSHVFF